MKLQSAIAGIVFGLLGVGVMVQATTINITGHVVNGSGVGLAGAKVALVGQNLSALSGADGSFTLSGTTGILSNSHIDSRLTLPYCIGNSIIFENPAPEFVDVHVVGLSGKTIVAYTEMLPAGTCRILPLNRFKGAPAASGVYFANISVAGISTTFQFSGVNFGNGRATAIAAAPATGGESTHTKGLQKSMAAVDTLVASLSGYDSTLLALTSFVGTYSLTIIPHGAPSAVTNLLLINQGGPNNAASQATNYQPAPLSNYQQISWHAATPGAYPISCYQILRNGIAYDTATDTGYIDRNATNGIVPDFSHGSTVYTYQVVAKDTHGNVGPQAAQISVYGYRNGYSNWSNSDLSYGTTENYKDVSGDPQGGPYDVSVTNWGGFQPNANPPQTPNYDIEVGGFNYFTIDVNPGATANYTVRISMMSRLPPGDVFPYSVVNNIFQYGPAPKANTWATYKVPLYLLNMGICNFTGSITGTKLKVTSVQSAHAMVDAGGFVTGGGVPAGTYILGHDQSSSIGTFTLGGPGITGSTSVPSGSMVYQRTSMYKFDIFPNSGNPTVYFNNFGFTTN